MSLIGRFEHLPKRPKSDQARPLLEKIASQVKPIMAKRGWKVGTLAEFLPSNPSLLGNNMNAGQRINLRLRPPADESNFYEYDQLVLVMLHEVHRNSDPFISSKIQFVQHGPHDTSFYRLLSILEEEYYDLKRKGYTGDGFHSNGNNLSGIKRDEYAGKKAGLLAAEKRLAAQRKVGKGGVLGGKKVDGRSLREIVAEAAERRIKDDKSCATGHSQEVEDEVKKAAEESIGIDAIDLTQDSDDDVAAVSPVAVDPSPEIVKTVRLPSSLISSSISSSSSSSQAVIKGSNPSKRRKPSPDAISSINTTQSATVEPVKPVNPVSIPTEWSCSTCTLLNPTNSLSCEVCSSPRPTEITQLLAAASKPLRPQAKDGLVGVAGKGAGIGIKEGWFCDFCGEGPVEWGLWSCQDCGYVRKFG